MILILSDINMPGMTGLELLPKAKAARPDVPVIMITAYGDDSTRRKALEGGAEALLTKPIDFVALRGEIDSRVAGLEPRSVKRHSRHLGRRPTTSGLLPETDILSGGRYVSKVPRAVILALGPACGARMIAPHSRTGSSR